MTNDQKQRNTVHKTKEMQRNNRIKGKKEKKIKIQRQSHVLTKSRAIITKQSYKTLHCYKYRVLLVCGLI